MTQRPEDDSRFWLREREREEDEDRRNYVPEPQPAPAVALTCYDPCPDDPSGRGYHHPAGRPAVCTHCGIAGPLPLLP